mmetsp:Transcript_23855/g.35253  ORF Transcript_23855/g.35253 Transcript_23855/m.35253 type:complete len:102 (+) Transcript_23855:99-404(+)|eukprot:CAMPEP_0194205350 /NCGR_PEP_ID=MMETSP0156-20130528/4648_1 /TAXON_ID=33649 /ORGANISM="Thalassionema nitzschioides, Strain L26-B" /LENGTH=101 /DNA_ID=CAMNT_0038931601 /DNA_START=99 /DNA_END=404 /DNA_ORIENTATION=-
MPGYKYAVVKIEEDNVDGRVLDAFMKASNTCDKFFNCAYVKKQLEEEWRQEKSLSEGAVGRVLDKLDRSLEVEIYRQLLFDENSVSPSDDDTPTSSPFCGM